MLNFRQKHALNEFVLSNMTKKTSLAGVRSATSLSF